MADKKPLQPEGGSPGQKDRLHAATSIQSSAEPEDYPLPEREGLVAVAAAAPKATPRRSRS